MSSTKVSLTVLGNLRKQIKATEANLVSHAEQITEREQDLANAREEFAAIQEWLDDLRATVAKLEHAPE